MKTAIMVAVIVLATSASDVLIARGLRRIGEIPISKLGALLAIGRKVIINRDFLAGIFFAAVSFFAFIIVLSWADLSLVVPSTSITYVITTVGAKIVLKERINRLRWIGTLFVCLGVTLISLP